MSIGETIKRIRLEKGLTQKQLGKRLNGISQQQIGQWETGKSNPKIETIQKIADALDTDVMAFLDLDTEKYEIKYGSGMTYKGEKLEPYEGYYIDLTDKAKLIDDYETLNKLGKKEALKRVEELTEIPRYTEPDK
ncbi:helix-turn-helix transcriptional regulator [Roseburia sp. BX1005]|uniref:Helix-turn-helix transcriptional regulator n=1 Tax=Roseburia zhanii TaxID=2763064 RepID=A0A923RRN8_9FIRM|nr:helix-turn-helix transcriptional regulator [Roseburia zhanii]MBC5712748.1 helix-turn-helix transcriptional regulator [Roseburia zhanii]